MKTLIFLFCLFLIPTEKSQTDWKLVWSDEFNYSGLPNASDWTNEVGFIRNHELQYYTENSIDNSVVKGGNLLIIGRKENYKGAGYTSASLVTDGKHSWKYGKIEARIKLPQGQGIWPAFWMLGQDIHKVGWPACGEIDIMEHINNEDLLHGTLHWDKDGKHMSSGGSTPCNVSDYHVYGIEWDKNAIKFMFDGKEYREVNISDKSESMEEFHKPQYIILNLAIGGDWPGNPDATSSFPDTVYVDYVRVYQKTAR
ncbi:MAG TPA: glycoside hydrolase family 16 protein [Bacteroidales bacterium]|nr:glycoside hydrolase family 16 protein [Bacteroidales bacterium]